MKAGVVLNPATPVETVAWRRPARHHPGDDREPRFRRPGFPPSQLPKSPPCAAMIDASGPSDPCRSMAASPRHRAERDCKPAPTRWSPAPRYSARPTTPRPSPPCAPPGPRRRAGSEVSARDASSRGMRTQPRTRAPCSPRLPTPAHQPRARRPGAARARPLARRCQGRGARLVKGELEFGGAVRPAAGVTTAHGPPILRAPRTASPGCATCARLGTDAARARARTLVSELDHRTAGRPGGLPARMSSARASPPGSAITISSPPPPTTCSASG